MKNSMMRRFAMVAMLAAVTAVAAPAQNAAARTFKVLYTFKGGTDGINPLGHLVMDAKGNLYGVTTYGGSNDAGIVFELSPPASGQTKWTETIILNTHPPIAGLIIDGNGALYGTQWGVGHGGAVFKLTPPASGSGAWTETLLDLFDQHEKEGYYPDQPVAIDSQGRIYGTTADGGPHGTGIVFMLTPSTITKEGEWKETILYDFPNGWPSQGNVTVDASGNVYGLDGSALFKLTPPKTGDIYYSHRILAPVCDNDAVGLTPHGAGFFVTCGSGIYEVTPPKTGTTWATSTVYTFVTAKTNPHGPTSAVTLGVNGELYVSTNSGGAYNHGEVMALRRPSSGRGAWTATSIHSMTGGSGGAYPLGSVFLDAKGNLYGSTYNGGNADTSETGNGGGVHFAPGDGIIYELPE